MLSATIREFTSRGRPPNNGIWVRLPVHIKACLSCFMPCWSALLRTPTSHHADRRSGATSANAFETWQPRQLWNHSQCTSKEVARHSIPSKRTQSCAVARTLNGCNHRLRMDRFCFLTQICCYIHPGTNVDTTNAVEKNSIIEFLSTMGCIVLAYPRTPFFWATRLNVRFSWG